MKRSISVAELTDELLRRRLIEDASTALLPGNERPWFISIVLGLSGWLAGIFALACVALLFKPDTPAGFAGAGLILLLAAFGLYAADRSGAFFDQLALALSIAGQLALTWAAADALKSEATTAALVAMMQVILLFVMPNALAKVLAAVFACCAWALAIRFAWWGPSDSYVMHQQITLAHALLAWFVVWIPIIAAVYGLIKTERLWMASRLRRLARPALNGLLVSLALATWVSEPNTNVLLWGGERQVPTNWLSLWPLLGAAGALYAALAAFQLRSRAMIGVSIAGALLHVAQFYYLLGTSLLMKSVIMLGVGVAALVTAYWLNDRNMQIESDAS
jgi:hypothetical protein